MTSGIFSMGAGMKVLTQEKLYGHSSSLLTLAFVRNSILRDDELTQGYCRAKHLLLS